MHLSKVRKKKCILLNQMRYLRVTVKVATNKYRVDSSLHRSYLSEQRIVTFPVSCYLDFSDLKGKEGENCYNSFCHKYFVKNMLIMMFMEIQIQNYATRSADELREGTTHALRKLQSVY